MITGELKNKIDSLWDIFAAGGLVNPLDVIEQITYLMFIHDLDDTDNLRAKEAAMLGLPYQSIFADEVQVGDRTIDGQQLKWSVFHDFPAGKMYSVMQEWVFPFIKNLHGDKNSAYSKYIRQHVSPLLASWRQRKPPGSIAAQWIRAIRFHDSSLSDTYGHRSRFRHYALTPPVPFGKIAHRKAESLPPCQCYL